MGGISAPEIATLWRSTHNQNKAVMPIWPLQTHIYIDVDVGFTSSDCLPQPQTMAKLVLALVMMQKYLLLHIVSAARFFVCFCFFPPNLVERYKAWYAFANGSRVPLGVELFHVPL